MGDDANSLAVRCDSGHYRVFWSCQSIVFVVFGWCWACSVNDVMSR